MVTSDVESAEATLKWGILGTGMIAKKFAADLKTTDRGELVATASRGQESADAFAAEFGGRGVEGYEALLENPEVEAVYNSLPNGLHAEWSIAAMRAGKHVLCEKPMAVSAAQAEEMFFVAEETGKVLIEAFMYRAHPGIQKVIKLVREGVIGELRLMRSNFTFFREASANDARYHPDQGGGSFMDVGCYSINFMRQLAGREPTNWEAMAHLHPLGVDDYGAGLLRFGDDLMATFTCGMTVVSELGTYLAGTEGTLEIDAFWFCKNPAILTRADGSQETVELGGAGKGLYALEAEAFAAAVRGDAEPWITAADTLANMRVLDGVREKAGVPVPGR